MDFFRLLLCKHHILWCLCISLKLTCMRKAASLYQSVFDQHTWSMLTFQLVFFFLSSVGQEGILSITRACIIFCLLILSVSAWVFFLEQCWAKSGIFFLPVHITAVNSPVILTTFQRLSQDRQRSKNDTCNFFKMYMYVCLVWTEHDLCPKKGILTDVLPWKVHV